MRQYGACSLTLLLQTLVVIAREPPICVRLVTGDRRRVRNGGQVADVVPSREIEPQREPIPVRASRLLSELRRQD